MKIKEILQLNEQASTGSTSAGSIASVSMPLGSSIIYSYHTGFDPKGYWKSIYNFKKKNKSKNKKKIF